MKKNFTIAAALLVLALAFHPLSAQQSSSHPVFSVNVPAERIPNLDKLTGELKAYRECTCKCGCYRKDLDTQADRAIAFLRLRAGHNRTNQKMAVVLDIDETSLSNYSEMLGSSFVYDSKVFDAWVNTAQAPAIPGTLRIAKEAKRLGVAVFFITGRADSERDATERNLRAQGFEWKQLTLRPASDTALSVGAYKSAARARIVAQGYKIILNAGDQWSDLKGAPEAEFSVKYPNPYYFIP